MSSKYKYKRGNVVRWATVVSLFFSAAGFAFACSPLAPLETPTSILNGEIRKNIPTQERICLDQDCHFIFEKSSDGYFSIGRHNTEEVPSEVLSKFNEQDFSDLKPTLLQQLKEGNVLFTAFDHARESEFRRKKDSLLNCRFTEYRRVGDWLVVEHTARDYCYRAWAGGGSCPTDAISYIKFADYIVLHVTEVPPMYPSILFGIAISLILAIVYLVRRKELWFFFKPRIWNVLVTGGIALVLLLYGSNVGSTQGMKWLPLIYFVMCVIAYPFSRRKA
ncbi:MAG: hypothetical protein EXS51_01845 [Candidatus Taylorbacteria bacterium]|nr:hypothetical protein [Candidatus Taylorbacteria bacterium]